jgi:hypothetical protein
MGACKVELLVEDDLHGIGGAGLGLHDLVALLLYPLLHLSRQRSTNNIRRTRHRRRGRRRKETSAHAGLGLLGVVEVVPHNVSDLGVTVMVILLAVLPPPREPLLLELLPLLLLLFCCRCVYSFPSPPTSDEAGGAPEARGQACGWGSCRGWGWERWCGGGEVAAEEGGEHPGVAGFGSLLLIPLRY